MYDLLRRGRFGNYPLNWRNLEALQASGYTGKVGIRSATTISNPVRLYHIPVAELPARIAAVTGDAKKAGFVFTEALDESKNTIQGEYDGRHLTYTFNKNPMKEAFRHECLHADGLLARGLLRHYLDPADMDLLDDLLHDFPDHVIEFSVFSEPLGQLQTRMIIWEVRLY